MASPFLVPLFSKVLETISSTAVSLGVARSESSLTTVQGRSLIWQVSLDVLGRSDWRHQLLGFGAQGFRLSGASDNYSSVLFGSSTSRGSYQVGNYDTHSTLLNLLFSVGWVGILCLTVVWMQLIKKVHSFTDPLGWAPLLIGAWTLGTMSATGTACQPSRATYALLASICIIYPFLSNPVKLGSQELDSHPADSVQA
jgi:hypothetical protein